MIVDPHSRLLSKMMELSTAQQRVVANNIANLNTPGYVRRQLSFQERLASAVERRDWEGLEGIHGDIVEDKSGPMRPDGNNVNVGTEMNALMQNGVYHALLTRAKATKSRIMRTAIG